MSFEPERVQKSLEQRNLSPIGGVDLGCPQPEIFNCQIASECKTCIRGSRYDLAKVQNIIYHGKGKKKD